VSDNITLPREVVELALDALDYGGFLKKQQSITALRTALAAPSEDIDALRRDAERYNWLLNWLIRTGLLTAQRCRIDAPETYGDWYILKKPYVVDGTALVGYGKTEDAAIDAAMQKGDKT
jgi:hypothetical protein